MSMQEWESTVCRFDGVELGVYLVRDNKYKTDHTKTPYGVTSVTRSTPFYHLVVYQKPKEYCGGVAVILRQEFSTDDREEAIEAFNNKVIDIINGKEIK